MRKVLPGPADKSYGIQVARLAGLPAPIIERAKRILTHLEMSASMREPSPPSPSKRRRKSDAPQERDLPHAKPMADITQLDLFDKLDPGI